MRLLSPLWLTTHHGFPSFFMITKTGDLQADVLCSICPRLSSSWTPSQIILQCSGESQYWYIWSGLVCFSKGMWCTTVCLVGAA